MSRRQRPIGRLASQRAARRRRGRHAPPGRPPAPGWGEIEIPPDETDQCAEAIDEALAEVGLDSDDEEQLSR